MRGVFEWLEKLAKAGGILLVRVRVFFPCQVWSSWTPRQINNQTQRYQDSVTVCVCGHWQQCHGLRRTCAG